MKNLLLIDDEINLLESLKEGLSSESDIFNTEIAFSVDEAIKLIKIKSFDLIITDIRMPNKSGLELLIFLKDNKYSGEVMVMTAYGDSETSSYIKILGGARVIAKPFDFEWFKDLLVEFFTKEGFSGTIDSIDLTTLLQVIHLEKKTTGIEIKINDDTGYLYFNDGELVNAEFLKFKGEEAAFKLIGLNKGHFNVIKNKKSSERLIKIPFMNFLMGVMKDVDEIVEKREEHQRVAKLIVLDEKVLIYIKEIPGYNWVLFFDEKENVILKDLKGSIEIDKYISLFSNIIDSAGFVLQKREHGDIELFTVQTSKEIYLFSELKINKLRIIINLDINGDFVKAKQIIKKITKTISDYMS